MSEAKRVPLIPLGSQKVLDKPLKDSTKSVRISVNLPESTEDTCPEYNYKDELAAAKKLDKYKESGVISNGLDNSKYFNNDNDNDDDVRRIARLMEEKHGTSVSLKKKRRKGRRDDYADIGMGYDESDSFIDNTDGYDEIIPENVTTLYGGFYINSGALEFKTDDKVNSEFSSSCSEDEIEKKTSRKRIIESSDETDRENKTETSINHLEKKRKMQNGGNGIQPSMKKKFLAQSKIYIKKRRPLDPQKKTVKELLKEKREDLNMSVQSELTETDNEQKDDISKDNNQKKMTVANVDNIIESVVKASTINQSSKLNNENCKNNVENVKITSNESNHSLSLPDGGESSHEISNASEKIVDVRLPENLPSNIVDIIKLIKEAASKSNEGKVKFFTSEVNKMILNLERKCKCLGKSSKLKVYEHLAHSIKCRRETLYRRAKHLVLDDDLNKLKMLLTDLKNEVNKLMPGLLDSYEKESKRVLDKKFSQESVDNDEMKSLRMPKRRFQWTEITKKLVKDILVLKKRCFLTEGKQREDLENQMLSFLKSDIQVIWPEGWMSMNALNKIYTAFSDPKRLSLSMNSSPSSNVVNNESQNLGNNNLSITAIVHAHKNHSDSKFSDTGRTKVESSIDLTVKSLPVEISSHHETVSSRPASPKKETDNKQKLKLQCEIFKSSNKKAPPDRINDSVIIVDSPKDDNVNIIDKFVQQPIKKTSETSAVSSNYYQEVKDLKRSSSRMMDSQEIHRKEIVPDLSITPNYSTKFDNSKPRNMCATSGDDIQRVMEDLKVLEKMSSPKKCDPTTASSAVPVIAVNKSFVPKNHNQNSVMQRIDYAKSGVGSEYSACTGFQDEFQKQLFSTFNNLKSNSSKTNYNSIDRYPHITSSSSAIFTGDKFFQTSTPVSSSQNVNGHKTSNSTIPQPGTYSILDDVFANLLTQFGYPKEVTTPKSQQK